MQENISIFITGLLKLSGVITYIFVFFAIHGKYGQEYSRGDYTGYVGVGTCKSSFDEEMEENLLRTVR